METRKANLFVVGAMKAGTTSFIEMLGQHPEIYVSPIKEPHYFLEQLPKKIFNPSRFFNLEAYFEKEFPASLHIANVLKEEHYQKLFSLAKSGHTYLAEASTGYLHDPNAAENIYRYNPDAKIIILLRDPLQRAYSHYKMDLGLGRTNKSFSWEIEKELTNIDNNKFDIWGYINMSLYYDNIKRYFDFFGNNVFLIKLSDYNKSPQEQSRQLLAFLGATRFHFSLEKNNSSKSLRFQKLLYLVHRSGLKSLMSHLLPQKFRHKLFNMLAKKEALPLELDKKVEERLRALFNRDQDMVNKFL